MYLFATQNNPAVHNIPINGIVIWIAITWFIWHFSFAVKIKVKVFRDIVEYKIPVVNELLIRLTLKFDIHCIIFFELNYHLVRKNFKYWNTVDMENITVFTISLCSWSDNFPWTLTYLEYSLCICHIRVCRNYRCCWWRCA